jgi:GNAT superfamily N-acetyltransferase
LTTDPLIREACADDWVSICRLLEELGYVGGEFVKDKLDALSSSGSDTVLVGEADGSLIAFGHLHTGELFHEPGRFGRVTALVVEAGWRRRGVGRNLMSAFEGIARGGGCTKMEVTSGVQRRGAHRFYASMGYQERPRRFVKELRSEGLWDGSTPSENEDGDPFPGRDVRWGRRHRLKGGHRCAR